MASAWDDSYDGPFCRYVRRAPRNTHATGDGRNAEDIGGAGIPQHRHGMVETAVLAIQIDVDGALPLLLGNLLHHPL